MRSASGWDDACILNISSRGLLLQATMAPARGSYLEVGRGPHLIVARVIWSKDNRFGVCTQDPLPVHDIIDPQSVATKLSGPTALPIADRRSARRPSERAHEESRWRSQAMQYGFVVLLGASTATMAYEVVEQTLGKALGEVETAFAAQEGPSGIASQ